MAENAPEKESIQKDKKKMPLKTLLILLAVFLLEGGAISVFFVMKGGPKPAEATDPIEQTDEVKKENFGEVVLASDFQVDNYMLGRSRMIVTLEVAAKVEAAKKDQLKTNVDEHSKEILSTIRVLISSAQPEQIKDPKKEVIKREIKTEVDGIVGEGLIKEILLPNWQTYVVD